MLQNATTAYNTNHLASTAKLVVYT